MQLLIILLLVLLNGLLAMSEIAVVSARRGTLREQAKNGSQGAGVALELSKDPNRFLSTVQIGITLVGVLAGAFGGTTIGRQIGNWLAEVLPVTERYSEVLGIAAIVLFTSYLSLVLGELVPKRLAMQYPEAISARVAVPMKNLSRVAAPVVWLLSASTNTILRLIGVDPNAEPTLSDAEVINMVREGSSDGVFDKAEVEMVRGVLQLDDKTVQDIMTPRPSIHTVDINQPPEDMKEELLGTPHSYYPVRDGDIDNIVGIIKAKDLLALMIRGETLKVSNILYEPLFIPSMTAVSRALQIFKTSGMQVAIIVEEHGSVKGLLTLNDVIEEIVGDVDADNPEVVQREDGSWLLDGQMPMTRFDEFLPDNLIFSLSDNSEYRTLAGFIMAQLQRMPKIGDHFIYEGLRFEVVDMDAARIDRILVEAAETES